MAKKRKAKAAARKTARKTKPAKVLSARKGKADKAKADKAKKAQDKVANKEAEQRTADSNREVAKAKSKVKKGMTAPVGQGGFRRDFLDNRNELNDLNVKADNDQTVHAGSAPPSGFPVLPAAVRAQAPIRPVRYFIVHKPSGTVTELPRDVAETLARDPTFYPELWAPATGGMHPIGEFYWKDTVPHEVVGSKVVEPKVVAA